MDNADFDGEDWLVIIIDSRVSINCTEFDIDNSTGDVSRIDLIINGTMLLVNISDAKSFPSVFIKVWERPKDVKSFLISFANSFCDVNWILIVIGNRLSFKTSSDAEGVADNVFSRLFNIGFVILFIRTFVYCSPLVDFKLSVNTTAPSIPVNFAFDSVDADGDIRVSDNSSSVNSGLLLSSNKIFDSRVSSRSNVILFLSNVWLITLLVTVDTDILHISLFASSLPKITEDDVLISNILFSIVVLKSDNSWVVICRISLILLFKSSSDGKGVIDNVSFSFISILFDMLFIRASVYCSALVDLKLSVNTTAPSIPVNFAFDSVDADGDIRVSDNSSSVNSGLLLSSNKIFDSIVSSRSNLRFPDRSSIVTPFTAFTDSYSINVDASNSNSSSVTGSKIRFSVIVYSIIVFKSDNSTTVSGWKAIKLFIIEGCVI